MKRLLVLLLLVGCGAEPTPKATRPAEPLATPAAPPPAPAEPAFEPFRPGPADPRHPVLLVAEPGAPWAEPLAELLRVGGIDGIRRATPDAVVAQRPDAGIVLLAPGAPDSLKPAVDAWLADRKDVIAIQPSPALAPAFGLRTRGVATGRWLKDDQARLLRLAEDSVRYGLVGSRPVAWLLDAPEGRPEVPAVSVKKHRAGGRAIAFAFDPARAVAWIRQGNPAWIGQDRDADGVPTPADLFFGGDEPDHVDWDGLLRPAADAVVELLLDQVTADAAAVPVPRFATLPHGAPAAVLLAVDAPDAAAAEVLNARVATLGAVGCAEAPAGCPRVDALQDTDGIGFRDPPSWAQWTGTAKAQAVEGARLDLSYGPGPAAWIAGRSGFVSGTARPARFADLSGATVPLHQLPVAVSTASGHELPASAEPLLEGAADGRIEGVLVVRAAHDDPGIDAFVRAAVAKNLPFVTAGQLADFWTAREAARFAGLAYEAGQLTFSIPEHGANGLHVLMPRQFGPLRTSAVDHGEDWVATTPIARDGRPMLTFPADPGPYLVQYVPGKAAAGGAAPVATRECEDDEAVAHFARGTVDGTEVVGDDGGAVILAPEAGGGFDDGRIPPSFRQVALTSGGAANPVDGALVLDGAELVGPSRERGMAVRARATFREPGQGLFLRTPGTGEDAAGLVRTADGYEAFVGDERAPLSAPARDVPVTIERLPDAIVFGVGKETARLSAHSGPLEVVARDADRGARTLTLDALALLPRRSEGRFVSRVLPRPAGLAWELDAPPGTEVRIDVRAGHRKEPPVAWSDWLPMAQPGFVEPHGAWVQYRATLVGDGEATPRLLAMRSQCGEVQDTAPDWDAMDPLKKAAAQSQR